MDGYSFCSHTYDLVIEPAVRPLWMSVNYNTIVIRSSTDFDPEDSITVTVKVNRDGERIAGEMLSKARLVCADGNNMCVRMLEIPSVQEPYYIQMTGSRIPLKSYEDSWYVSRNFYKLTKVEMQKKEDNALGFKVTFTRADYKYYRDWPAEITHTFGSTTQSRDYVSVDLTAELTSIEFCGQYESTDEQQCFKGFNFFVQGSSDPIPLTSTCTGRKSTTETVTLVAEGQDSLRLLGFRAVLWDVPYRNRRNPERFSIKRLEPIVSKIPDCYKTSLMMDYVPDISVGVNAGFERVKLAVPDTINSFTGAWTVSPSVEKERTLLLQTNNLASSFRWYRQIDDHFKR